jgi:hypothetical protein
MLLGLNSPRIHRREVGRCTVAVAVAAAAQPGWLIAEWRVETEAIRQPDQANQPKEFI